MNTNEPDYYDILQVAPGAEQEVIGGAYRRLARKYHPDVNKDPSAPDRMKQLNAAFAVLGDPTRRAAYDSRRTYSPPSPDEHGSSDEDENRDDIETDDGEGHPSTTPYTPPRPRSRYSWWQVVIIALGLAVGIPTTVIALRDASRGGPDAPTTAAVHPSTVPATIPANSIGWDDTATFQWTLDGLQACSADPTSLDPLLNASQRACVETYMRNNGATANAIRFLDETGVFFDSFLELGRVDYGTVGAPWVNMGRPSPALLNGTPTLITADQLLPPAEFTKTPSPWPEYATLSNSQPSADGGQILQLSYPLRSCRACTTVDTLVLQVQLATDGRVVSTTIAPVATTAFLTPTLGVSIVNTVFAPTNVLQLDDKIRSLYQAHPDLNTKDVGGGHTLAETVALLEPPCTNAATSNSTRATKCANFAFALWTIALGFPVSDLFDAAVMAKNYALTEMPDQKETIDKVLADLQAF